MDVAEFPVSAVMKTEVVTATERTTVREAVRLVLKHEIAGLPVIAPDRRLLGVISEKELLVLAAAGDLDQPIKYNAAPDVTRNSEAIKNVLIKTVKQNRKWMPVLDEAHRLVGVIARRDLLRVLLENE